MKKFYVTTPIYYVNANPHIGHTYTTVAADCLARYHRLAGDKTFFLIGTDEHGAKIEEWARNAGQEPQAFVDEVAASFRAAWDGLAISYDNFIRTTDPAHERAVGNALEMMYAKGDIYKGSYKGLYCRGCEQFKNEKDLVDGLCPDHKTRPEEYEEESYMFRLSKYQDVLLKKIKSGELKISPENRRNEVLSFYENEGLNDVSFSRKNVKWGIPVPWDTTHTCYVWADAFLNYLTGLGWDGTPNPSSSPALSPSPEREENVRFWPAEVQLMSKDILRVHATIWPAMLLSLGLELPKEIFIHGFFLIDGQKMSKSLGNVIAPGELVLRYGADAARYLLMSATPFGNDGDISWAKFDEKYNADLANGLGNLAARVSNLLEKNEIMIELRKNSDEKLIKQCNQAMDGFHFDEALKIIWEKLRQADSRLTEKAPWKMTDKEKISEVLEPIAADILNAAVLLEPFMPVMSQKIVTQFSEKQIKKGEPLFPRLAQ